MVINELCEAGHRAVFAPERWGSGGSQWWSPAGWRWEEEGRMAAQCTPMHGLGLAARPMATSLSTLSSPLPTSPLPLGALQGQLWLHELPRVSLEAPGLGTSQHQHSGFVASRVPVSFTSLLQEDLHCPLSPNAATPLFPDATSPYAVGSVLPSLHFHYCFSLCCPWGRDHWCFKPCWDQRTSWGVLPSSNSLIHVSADKVVWSL